MTPNRIVVPLINGRKDIAFGRTIIINYLNISRKEVGQSELKVPLVYFSIHMTFQETYMLECAFFVYFLDGIQCLCDARGGVGSMEVVSLELGQAVSQWLNNLNMPNSRFLLEAYE
jgi:hypothetical protein